MRAINRYAAAEVLFIHWLTGLLFAATSALIVAGAGAKAPWALLIVVPVLLVSWAGWAAQARAAAAVARSIRESGRERRQ